jgi:hypothetical protein
VSDTFQQGPDRYVIYRGLKYATVEPQTDIRVGELMSTQLLLWGVPLAELIDEEGATVAERDGRIVVEGRMREEFKARYYAKIRSGLRVRAAFRSQGPWIPTEVVMSSAGRVIQIARTSDFRPFGGTIYPRHIEVQELSRAKSSLYAEVKELVVNDGVGEDLFRPVAAEPLEVFDRRLRKVGPYSVGAGQPLPDVEGARRLASARRSRAGIPISLDRLVWYRVFALFAAVFAGWYLLRGTHRRESSE